MERGRLSLALLLLAVGLGCSHSRWALRDPDYAQHYPQQAETHLETAKQALDARHVAGKSGTFVGGGGSALSPAGIAEFGMFGYGWHCLEYNGSLVSMYHEEETDLYLGLAGGLRAQSPSRVAPFVGVGGFAGLIRTQTAVKMILDDDDDCGCEEEDWERLNPMFTVYPEVGMHFWLDTDTRVTTSVSYHVSTEGRDSDMVMFSLEWATLGLPAHAKFKEHYGRWREEAIPLGGELREEGPALARLPNPTESRAYSQAAPSASVPGVYQLPETSAPSMPATAPTSYR